MSRVLIAGLCAVPGPNRVGIQMGHVLRALAPHHNVDVLCVRRGDQPYVERQGNARILRVPLHEPEPRAQIDAFRRAVGRQLEGAEYDIAHVRDSWAGLPVLEARERLRCAVVFDATRAPYAPGADPATSSAELTAELVRDEDQLLLAADIVLVPHEPARRHIAARGRPDRVHVVRPGVDVDQFDYDELPARGPARLLYLGGLEPGRGIQLLLRAMVEVARVTSARLSIAGPFGEAGQDPLVAELASLGLRDRVEFLGRVDHREVPELIASSSICVAPAAAELTARATALYPTKILEYMACRRAVVAPRTDTVALLAKEGVHAELFNPGDPDSLARSLISLLETPSRREALAEAGYQMVRARCTASGTRRQLRAAYRALANQPGWVDRLTRERQSPEAAPVAVVGEENETTELSDGDLLVAGSPVTETDRQLVADSEHTRVDAPSVGWLDLPSDPDGDVPTDEAWVVQEAGQDTTTVPAWDANADDDADDDGTPLDVRAVRAQTSPVESRFVAGEIDVPTEPRPRTGSAGFTAVGELLGGWGVSAESEGRESMVIDPEPDTVEAGPDALEPAPRPREEGSEDS